MEMGWGGNDDGVGDGDGDGDGDRDGADMNDVVMPKAIGWDGDTPFVQL